MWRDKIFPLYFHFIYFVYYYYMSKLNIRKHIKIIPITPNNESVTKGSIVLQFGCTDLAKYNDKTHREKVKIFLQLKDEKYKEFIEDLLQKLAVTIQLVTGFILGPLTVVELYNDPFLNDLAEVIINDTTNKLAIYDKNCFSDELQIDHSFRGQGEFIRSVKLWDYDYYMNNRAIRYCNTDFDCGLSEYCLCPNGNYNGDLCPLEKKRCMPMAEYNDQLERELVDSDIVNQQCLNYGINKYKHFWNKKIIPFSDLKRISAYCSKREFINKYPQDLSLNYYFKVDNVNPKFNIERDGYRVSKEHFYGGKHEKKINIWLIVVIVLVIISVIYYCVSNNK